MCDSGIVHALLRLPTREDVLGHPVAGGSWEGFVIESLLAAAPEGTDANFYRTSAGAKIDLLLSLPDDALGVTEIKRGSAPKVGRGFHQACADLKPAKQFIVYGGTERFPLNAATEAINLAEMAALLQSRGRNNSGAGGGS